MIYLSQDQKSELAEHFSESLQALSHDLVDTILKDTIDNIMSDRMTDKGQFDAGILADGGGGDIDWWHDYIRSLLNQAHEYYTKGD